MNFSAKLAQPEKQRSDCLIVAVSEPRRLSASAEAINKASNSYLSQLLKRGDIEGKFGQFLLLQSIPGVTATRILLVGQGQETLTEVQFRDLISRLALFINETPIADAVNYLIDINVKEKDTTWKIQQIILILQPN